MAFSAAVLLALSSWAFGQGGIPFGLAPAHRAAPGFTLNAEVLGRYGYTLDAYNALGVSERSRVSDWIEALEDQAASAAAAARSDIKSVAVIPQNPSTPADQESLTRLRLGSAFDSKTPSGSGVPAFIPDVSLTGGQFRRFSLIGNEKRFDFGLLGADGESPLLAPSPYVNYSVWGAGSGRVFDTSYKAQLGVVQLGARLFTPDAPAMDAKIDAALPGITAIQVPTGFETQTMPIGSALGQMGRAYHLFGPVDAAWSALGEARLTDFLPNVGADQSGALRLRLGGSNVALVGGVSEGIGLVAKDFVAKSLAADGAQFDPSVQAAPHASVMAWGKLPYVSGAQYELEAGRQWNPWTTVQTAEAGVSLPAGAEGRVGLRGTYSDESGADIEFGRRKAGAQVSYSPNPGFQIWGQYGQDSATYGSAQVDNRSVMLGVTLTEQGSNGPVGSATMASRFGGQDQLVSQDKVNAFAQELQTALTVLRALKDSALGQVGGAGGGWQDIQNGWNSLNPALRADLEQAWKQAAPSLPSLADLISTSPDKIKAFDKLADFLADTAVLDRLMTRYLRHELLSQLEAVKIPILGHSIRLSAPIVVAAAHAYSLGLSPIPPVTAADARNSLDPFLINKLAGRAGCKTGNSNALTDCLLSQLSDAQKAALKKAFGDDLTAAVKEAVSWPSDIIRREVDAAMLQVMLAAERLNELTVDKGERLSAINEGALKRSFTLLDERARQEQGRALTVLRESVQRDLKAEDEALRAKLADYGQSRLAWIQAQPNWPEGVRVAVRPGDWGRLLAIYGDAALFDLILRAKARLVERGRRGLLIELDEYSPLGGIMVRDGEPVLLSLPAKRVDLSLFSL